MSNVDIGRYGRRLVQMLWDPEPRNDDVDNSPIWCLGRQYSTKTRVHLSSQQEDVAVRASSPSKSLLVRSKVKPQFERRPTSGEANVTAEHKTGSPSNGGIEEWPCDFLDDFESRIRLTYRYNFPPIAQSEDPKAASTMSLSVRLKSKLLDQDNFTSDTGWGCMIRSGQSLLANSLYMLRLGRESRGTPQSLEERQVLSLFADDPRAPFSIHKFVEHGAAACGTHPGQWFGPSATAKCIQALCNTDENANLKVYVTGDGPDVFEDALLSIAKGEDAVFRPTLLLVGTRLGIDRVTPVYREALRTSLMMPQSVGIAGGRPSSSHYFIGTQSTNFFYLDPHQTQTALPFHENAEDYTLEEIDSCHTRRLRRLPVEEMDPSMLIAFLFRNEDDWQSWRQSVSEAPGKQIFNVADTQPSSHVQATERGEAIFEVETFDDDEHVEGAT